MRFIPFLIAVVWSTTAVSSFAGVDFIKEDFEKAREEAKAQNKMIMVDFYTDWCKWCKKLDTTTFRDETIGKFINQRFVSVKIDAEKGDGPDLRKKFRVPGYPTVVFLDAGGDEIDRIVGYAEPDQYFQMIKDYAAGKNTLGDYLERAKKQGGTAELHHKIAKKYDDRQDPTNALPHFMKVIELDPDNTSGYLEESSYFVAAYAFELNDDLGPLEKYAEEGQAETYVKAAYRRIARAYSKRDDHEMAMKTYENAIKRYQADANMRNAYAWHIFKNKLENAYTRGLEVAREAVKLEPKADAIWDTLGQLYFANGQVKEAIGAMKEAVKLNPGQDSYQKNLEEYEAAMGDIQGN